MRPIFLFLFLSIIVFSCDKNDPAPVTPAAQDTTTNDLFVKVVHNTSSSPLQGIVVDLRECSGGIIQRKITDINGNVVFYNPTQSSLQLGIDTSSTSYYSTISCTTTSNLINYVKNNTIKITPQ
jgi:hypothetical protein